MRDIEKKEKFKENRDINSDTKEKLISTTVRLNLSDTIKRIKGKLTQDKKNLLIFIFCTISVVALMISIFRL